MDAMDYEFEEERAAWEARRDEAAHFAELEARMAAKQTPATIHHTAREVQAILRTALGGRCAIQIIRPRKIDHLVRGSR